MEVKNKTQKTNNLEYEPGGHCWHSFCAYLSWNWPGGHNEQWL